MKAKRAGLSRRYEAALLLYLKQGTRGDTQPALGLGRRAAALGLETLDVVRMHQNALVNLELASRRDGIIGKAEKFFTKAIAPIEKTHRTALAAGVHLRKLNKTLGRRTADLAISNKHLMQGVIRRKGAEAALRKSASHHSTLLKESHRLQEHLRQLTRRILSLHEDKRKKLSRKLHDDIAQTLLGINVRLLLLRKEAATNAAGLKKEIASTQRLVEKSVRIMRRFGGEFGE